MKTACKCRQTDYNVTYISTVVTTLYYFEFIEVGNLGIHYEQINKL